MPSPIERAIVCGPEWPPLKIFLLSRSRNSYATRRFLKAARVLGHELHVLNPLKCTLLMTTEGHELHHDGERLEQPDLLLARVSTSMADCGLAVIEQFEMMGVRAVNSSAAIARTLDSVRSLQLLASSGVKVVNSVMVRSPKRLREAVDLVGGPPVLLELLRGNLAVGAILADSLHAAESTLETLWELGQNILLQHVLPGAEQGDIRALVIGGRVVACLRRPSLMGVFRPDPHLPANAAVEKVTPARAAVAIKAASVLDLGVAAVDMQEGPNGPVVMAVHASPALKWFERLSGVDAARLIVEFAAGDARRP